MKRCPEIVLEVFDREQHVIQFRLKLRIFHVLTAIGLSVFVDQLEEIHFGLKFREIQ